MDAVVEISQHNLQELALKFLPKYSCSVTGVVTGSVDVLLNYVHHGGDFTPQMSFPTPLMLHTHLQIL